MTFTIVDGPGSQKEPQADTSKLIDKGPFFDRFGAFKMTILTSQDPVIKAVITDINVRLWIDLANPEVATTLDYLIANVPGFTAELKDSILNTPVGHLENLGLRKLYFN